MRSGGLGTEKRGFQVGVERSIPGSFGGFPEFGLQEVRRAVDEDVEVAETSYGAVDEFLDRANVAEFRGEGGGFRAEFLDFLDELVGCGCGFSVVNGEVDAFLGKAERDRAAKALCRSRDQSHAAVELFEGAHGREGSISRMDSSRSGRLQSTAVYGGER